jgi:hypothetical protein
MSTESAQAGALKELPPALKGRAVLIHSDNPEIQRPIMVCRWSIEKARLLLGDLLAIYRDLPQEIKDGVWKLGSQDEAERDSVDFAEIGLSLMETASSRLISVAELSVAPLDREHVREMDADELLDIFEAIIEVNPNLIPKLKKKGRILLERFGLAGPGAEEPTTPSKRPTASSAAPGSQPGGS